MEDFSEITREAYILCLLVDSMRDLKILEYCLFYNKARVRKLTVKITIYI